MSRQIGILGGGQLGMMLASSLYKLGADVAIYDPDPDAPAKRRFADVTTGAWNDHEALSRFVARCDVLTYEFENVDRAALSPFEGRIPILPSPRVLETTQHRAREKAFCQSVGLPHARFLPVRGTDELAAAARDFGLPFILKTARGGYDGKGQWKVANAADLDAARAELERFGPELECVLEEIVPIALETSAIVARSPLGDEVVFPVFENMHANHVLDFTLVPARIPPDVASTVRDLALHAARSLDVRGLLTTEFFVTKGAPPSPTGLSVGEHQVFVNEFAPRPHNSGHVTRGACSLSQFDALARILRGIPLNEPCLSGEGFFCMGNLLGDLWVERGSDDLDFSALVRHPEVLDVLLYGKKEARRGRKMGHFVARGPDAEALLERARAFRADLARKG
jgi:5-(carboxyamino)imidazole ribonucleotide synthase